MAKSTSFFGLRRGSTKSLTFQVLDGKQVTKDRVAVVKNPKTSRQAEQRAKLLPAIRFMAVFGGIVDHSFENIAYGQKSKQHFLSMAMRTKPTNPMLKGKLGWYPQAYTISEGSLPSMNASRNGDETMGVDGLKAVGVSGSVTFDAFLITQGGVLQEGDQLTVITCHEVGATYFMQYDRVIVNAENWDAANRRLTTQNNLYIIGFTGEDKATVTSNNDEIIFAGAVILSRRASNKWLRSTEEMFCDFLGYEDWNASVASYMTAASELTSPWYLNAADNDIISPADIEGGEWSPVMLGPSQSWGNGTTIYLGAKNNLYGNFAVVTTDGTSGGFAFTFAGLSSGKTIKDVVLSDFTQSQTRGNAVMPEDVAKYGSFGSETLTTLADGQPDQFVKASSVGK